MNRHRLHCSPLSGRAWFLGVFLVLSAGMVFSADPGPYPRDDKSAAREWFWKWWPKGHEMTTGFTGSYEDGVPGTTSDAWREAMETRMNTFRRVVGLGPVTQDPEYNRLCQAGAILILSDWSHAPAKTAKNWTPDGYKAAQSSLLATGETMRNPVMDLIYDGGVATLGHRSSILTPGLKKTGFGAASSMIDLSRKSLAYAYLGYNNDKSASDPDPNYTDPFVMWPAKGWIPTRLIPANWSIDLADYWSNTSETGPFLDLRSVTIEVWRNGVKMPVGGGSNTYGFYLVFSLDGTPVNTNPYKEGGSGKVVDGVQTPVTTFITNRMLFGHDVMHGEVSAWGLNAETEDPFGDVIYDVKLSGINVRETGALWNGTGVYEYQVKGFDLQTPRAVPDQAKLISISTRSPVRTGSGVQIAGFVVGGTQPRKVLIRGSGPALTQFGVADVLADPKLSVHRLEGEAKILIGTNDNWSNDEEAAAAIESVGASVGAFPWSRGIKDAALVLTLAPGNYTSIVEGADGGTGNGLVEVYDAETTDDRAKVVSISSRTYVGDQGSDYQIAGFVLKGDKPRTVLIRVTGRDLEPFGVKDVLDTPQFQLYAGQQEVGDTLDPFQGGAGWNRLVKASEVVGAFPVSPKKEAAMALLTLLPNVPYTVVVTGTYRAAGTLVNTKGNALVEVYEFP
jgi:hypothetical protein